MAAVTNTVKAPIQAHLGPIKLIKDFLVLAARYIALLLPIRFYYEKLEFVPNTGIMMTWGGLRGGISIALALSLGADMHRDLILTITYIIVIFSIIVQGLTIGKVAKAVLN